MAEILNFDSKDTLLRLALNGDENKIVEFDPGDVNIRRKFFNLKDKMIQKQQELDSIKNRLDLEKDEDIQKAFKLEEDLFDFIRDEIEDLFKPGTTEMICGNRKNVFVLANFIIALVPYFEKFKKDTESKYINKFKSAGVL